VLVLLAGFGLGAFFFGSRLPSSFMPDEDQGYIYVSMQLPIARQWNAQARLRNRWKLFSQTRRGVQYTTTVVGFNLLSFAHTSYNSFFFVTLKPWGERKGRAEQYQEIKNQLNQELSRLPVGTVFGFSPPAVPRVGTSGGFQFVLEDRSGKDVKFLSDNLNKFLAVARKRPEIAWSLPHLSRACHRSTSMLIATKCLNRGCDQRCVPDHSGIYGRAVR